MVGVVAELGLCVAVIRVAMVMGIAAGADATESLASTFATYVIITAFTGVGALLTDVFFDYFAVSVLGARETFATLRIIKTSNANISLRMTTH